ncbi:hypothetical protein PCANC_22538 [Puccinia coronata f. sp. avenae]|uniref:Uncharacterized protein n=1 Tax=Puccinia coronata f. sp. avenae TaxID=200324 RepID=A0A2N5TWJ0_9BASI|nr:hypothetical protein PCANC_22538 [Puccinia coronata f. sp. avenae]
MSANPPQAVIITPSRIISDTDNDMPDTHGQGDLDSFIQPPPPLVSPAEVEIIPPPTHASHLAPPVYHLFHPLPLPLMPLPLLSPDQPLLARDLCKPFLPPLGCPQRTSSWQGSYFK